MVLTPDGLFTLGTVPAFAGRRPQEARSARRRHRHRPKRQARRRGSGPRSRAQPSSSCVSRIGALGSRFAEEVDAIQREFSGPLVGVLSLGEIASSPGNVVEFYNKTTVVLCR
jgi:hypothetical protein